MMLGDEIMIFNYNDMLKKYGSDYQILKAVSKKEVFKLEKGIYSDKQFVSYLAIIAKKYPNAIFTSESAFYYHNLTDVIPQKYFLATGRNTSKINSDDIFQVFVPDEYLQIGKTNMIVNGVSINIYDKERMLIELMKTRKSLPFDYYKEIVLNYREIINELDMEKIEEYLSLYKNDVDLYEALQREVF